MGKVFTIANSQNMNNYLTKVFGEIDLGIQEAINQTIDEIGKELSKKLRDTSPPKPGSKRARKYAKGWRYRASKLQSDGSFSAVVYNARYGWLTHLLEYGHPVRKKDGSVRWVEGQPHIGPADEWCKTEGVAKLQRAIQNELSKIKT